MNIAMHSGRDLLCLLELGCRWIVVGDGSGVVVIVDGGGGGVDGGSIGGSSGHIGTGIGSGGSACSSSVDK